MTNLTQNLGLCKKAGALILGFDAVIEAAVKGKTAGIMTTRDLSEKTLKEVNFHAERLKITVISLPVGMIEIKAITGKKAGVLGITNKDLFTLFEQVSK